MPVGAHRALRSRRNNQCNRGLRTALGWTCTDRTERHGRHRGTGTGPAGPVAEDRMTHLVGTAIRRRLRSERGSFSAMIIGLIVMLLMVVGLVIDGGLALNARAQTYDDLEQAARLGANEIDAGALRSSCQVVLIPGQAEAKATAFLHQL